jgi:hypothetical protein
MENFSKPKMQRWAGRFFYITFAPHVGENKSDHWQHGFGPGA